MKQRFLFTIGTFMSISTLSVAASTNSPLTMPTSASDISTSTPVSMPIQTPKAPPSTGAYITIAGGYSFPQTDTWDRSSGNTKTSYNSGFDGSVALGYRFDRYLRAEFQGITIYNDVNTVKATNFDQKMDGYSQAWGIMGNAYFDFANSSHFTPYVGAGFGFSTVLIKNKQKTSPSNSSHSYIHEPALEGIAGLNYTITQHWLVGINYTLFYALPDDDFNFIDRNPSINVRKKYNADYLRNLINLTVTYRF